MKPTTSDLWQLNKYLWICLLFIAWFIYAAHRVHWITAPLPVAYAVYGLALVNGAARSWVGFKRGGNSGLSGWAFTLMDVTLISIAVYITNGIYSELWLAYYVVLVSEALYSTTTQTSLLNICIVAGYIAATWTMRDYPNYVLTVTTRMFFVVTVGSFGLRISTDREKRNREVIALREQAATSDERARIAREVHDSLGHALVASILRLELCLRLLRRAPEEAEKLLQEEVPALRNAWNEGRDLAFHLRPWERDPAGTAATLRRHISRFAERTGLAVNLSLEGLETKDPLLPVETEMALTRILQESLTNIARHARATEVSIHVERLRGGLCCRVQDNGVGFDAETKIGSFGLTAMRERAEKLGGAFALQSRPEGLPNAGTSLEFTLPLPK